MDKFQTVGAVLAIVLLFFQLFDRIPAIHRFTLNSIRLPKRVWKMFSQWWYWKQHSPLYSITKFSSFRISKSDGSAEIEVTMSCRSRVKTIDKTIIEGRMLLGIGGSTPKLSCYSNPLVLSPGEKKEGIICGFRGNIHLASLMNLEDSIRKIGPVVRCKIKVEKIVVRGLVGDRSINLKSFKANVEYVSWKDVVKDKE